MPDMQQILTFVFTIGIPVVVLLSFILANAMYLQLMERKVLAHMQSRLGPMRRMARHPAARCRCH
jgi:NADH:ubiquinone oxidoreductase subunit H